MTKVNFLVYFGVIPFLLGLLCAPAFASAKVYDTWQESQGVHCEERACVSASEKDEVIIEEVQAPTSTPLQAKSQAEVKLELQEGLNESLNEKIKLLEELIALLNKVIALQAAAKNER